MQTGASQAMSQAAGPQTAPHAQTAAYSIAAGATSSNGVGQVRIAHGGAGACPSCFGYVYANRYTWAHLFIGLCFFPPGFLVYVFPVRRCQCGNEYGFGRWVVSICTWIAVLVLALLILVLAVGVRESAERTSSYRVGPHAVAVASANFSSPPLVGSIMSWPAARR